MSGFGFRSATLLVVCVVAALVSAQVTFSRDWSGGKRAPPAFDCGQLTTLCRQFIRELNQAMSTEALAKHQRIKQDDAPLYADDM